MSDEGWFTDVSAWVEEHAIEEDDELEEGEIREGDIFENAVKLEEDDELEEGVIGEGDIFENAVKLEEDDELEEGVIGEGDRFENVAKLEEDDELEEGGIREGYRFENSIKLEEDDELEEGVIGEGDRFENGVKPEEDDSNDEISLTNVIIDGRAFTLPRTIGHPLYPRQHPNIFQFASLTINDLQDIICSPTVHFRYTLSDTGIEIVYHVPARLMSMNSYGFSLAYVSEINSGWYGIGYLLISVDETSIDLLSTLGDARMSPDDWFQALPVFIRWCWTGLLILGYDVGPHAQMACLLEFGEAVGSPRFIAQVREASKIPENL